MNAKTVQELVFLKNQLVQTWDMPWKYIEISKLAFLCGQTERSAILEAIALFYGNTVGFLEDFCQVTDNDRWLRVDGSLMLQEARAVHQHFKGDNLIEYSPAWEEKNKKSAEVGGKGLGEVLAGYPETVPWQFEYDVARVDKFVAGVLQLVQGASPEALNSIMTSNWRTDRYILASVASRLVRRKFAPSIKNCSMGDSAQSIAKQLGSLPLEYVWHIAKKAPTLVEGLLFKLVNIIDS